MRDESGAGKSVAGFPLCLHFFAARFFLRPAILSTVLALLTSTGTSATTVEQVSFRRVDNVAEVDFHILGAPPRWHLQAHGQELWLDLEHSGVSESVEPASGPVVSPLVRVGMHDFGGGRVRLVIRVRGEVDYVVAQMAHVLVVRIAPSDQAVDLAQPLLSEMERSSTWPNRLARSARRGLPPAVNPRQAITQDGPRRVFAESVNVTNLQPRADSANSSSDGTFSASPLPGPALAAKSERGYSDQQVGQTVQPAGQHIAASPLLAPGIARPIVVIDAGHGGFDPGTESVSGVTEKTLALAIARLLATALQSRGINAELTRDDDRFLSLGERTELANRAHASLFVSIHLNSSPDWNTSGIETYYLNNTTDRATIRLARIENGGDYSAPGQSNLHYILANLRQDYKAHEASSLARKIEAEVAMSIGTTLGVRVNALGAKMGPFYVLVGAEMPSVLIECGFLSNPREAQSLIQPSYQEALADGIAVAIMHYFYADAAAGNL